ncbi:hypothetical protein DB313_06220 (plasmid) [Borrelia turcica IST7]|uniref:Uncharacterized protein n=1 Tax=Borrelia turcica IST7 TaxID=1104446 RepID=A0A386PQE0_9SPIR|nr:DUF792 family protein [Borrelia turcica]AYE37095.1 hypothetical protein DB313_06220 [Borrelia turcica IST7]
MPIQATNTNPQELEQHDIINIVKASINQVFSLFGNDNYIVLFPRMDLKGFGYIPQLFFIKPKGELLSRTYNTSCSKRPVINFATRKAEYVSYNPVMTGETIALSGAVLTSVYKEMLEPLKSTPFGNSLLEFDSSFVKEQLANRIEAQVPFSAYSPTFGLKELVVLTSVSFKDTPFIDEVEISINIEVIKTFAISSYKG